MKKIYLSLLLVPISVLSQTFEWVNFLPTNFSMNPDYIGYTNTVDHSGNIYVSGFKDTPYNYTVTYGNLYFNKYSPDGSMIFTKNIQGRVTVYDLLSDSNNNIIAAISFINTITIDNVTIITSNSGENPLLVKFNSNGDVIWHKQIKELQSSADDFRAIAIDSNDNIYVGYDDFFNSNITKISPSGELLLTIPQQNVKVISSLSIDNEGNIYSAGSCAENSAQYNGVSQPTNLTYNNYVTKYSSTGVHQWTKYVEDVTCINPIIVTKSPNEVYLSSTLSDNFNFGAITTEGPIGGGTDFFIARINSEGNFQWVKEVPGAGKAETGNRNFLNLDAQGNIYFAGRTQGTINWNNTINTSISGFSSDLLLLKYNPNGELLFAKTAGGSSSDRLDSVSINENNSIYLAGMAVGNSTFDSIQHNASGFDSYPFLAKINTESLQVNENDYSKIEMFPNPAKDFITINGLNEPMTGKIFNTLGQNIKDIIVTNNDAISIATLQKGLYFIVLDNKIILKFLKE